jgi:hypothetical protein
MHNDGQAATEALRLEGRTSQCIDPTQAVRESLDGFSGCRAAAFRSRASDMSVAARRAEADRIATEFEGAAAILHKAERTILVGAE